MTDNVVNVVLTEHEIRAIIPALESYLYTHTKLEAGSYIGQDFIDEIETTRGVLLSCYEVLKMKPSPEDATAYGLVSLVSDEDLESMAKGPRLGSDAIMTELAEYFLRRRKSCGI